MYVFIYYMCVGGMWGPLCARDQRTGCRRQLSPSMCDLGMELCPWRLVTGCFRLLHHLAAPYFPCRLRMCSWSIFGNGMGQQSASTSSVYWATVRLLQNQEALNSGIKIRNLLSKKSCHHLIPSLEKLLRNIPVNLITWWKILTTVLHQNKDSIDYMFLFPISGLLKCKKHA